jgi:hypothetical protein
VPAEAPTIAAGLDSALAGDEIVIACGVYEEADLHLKSGVSLHSETGLADCVSIDASDVDWPSSVIVSWAAVGTRLIGITVTGGHALYHYFGDHGGALKITGGDLEVIDCVFTGNEAYAGGAVTMSWDATPVFRRCTIAGNTATIGGGVELFENVVMTADDCVIADNSASGSGPDGLVRTGGLARLICCEIDISRWANNGTIEVIDDDCGTVRVEGQTWGAVKALFR